MNTAAATHNVSTNLAAEITRSARLRGEWASWSAMRSILAGGGSTGRADGRPVLMNCETGRLPFVPCVPYIVSARLLDRREPARGPPSSPGEPCELREYGERPCVEHKRQNK